jgi:Zn-dependent protease with chaperone function
VELNESQFKKIWAASHEIMLKMKLSHKLRIYYVKKNQAEASVVLEGNTIYLLLSRGMITYSQHNFKDVESIIGHEFGHVCQGDSKILLIGKNTIQIPLIMSVASWIFLKFGDYTALTGMFRLQQDLGGSWFILFYCWLFVVQRREAEYLADVASIIFVENSTIKDIIEKSVPQSGNLNYPSKSRRLAFIQKSLEKYNSMSQPFPVF